MSEEVIGELVTQELMGEIELERTYAIAPFENLKVHESLGSIPKELALDRGFMNTISYLLLLSMESVWHRYNVFTAQLENMVDADKIKFLESEKQKLLEKLQTTYHIKVEGD